LPEPLIERTAFSARDEAHAVRERTPTLSVVTSPDSTGPWRNIDPQRWIGVNGSEVVRTGDGGQTWVRSPAVGPPGDPESFLMADAQHGSVLVGMNVCLTFKSNCSSRTGLYATVDGGSTWTQLWPR
jgi:hypothetical protein